jgi:hypothetical protein
MKILQVKNYNNKIAFMKWNNALERWKERGYGYPAETMFFFTFDNGEKRKNGYVAFDEDKAIFGMNRLKAKKLFEERR